MKATSGLDLVPLPSALGRAAIDLGLRRLPVFPIRPRSKVPLLARSAGGRGFKDATTDPELIAEWWTRWPNANIGMATGRLSGIYVVDLDGAEARETWRERFPDAPIPRTTWAGTGRPGGLHLWFAYPPGAGLLPCATLGPSLETRGDGGYVLVAPSVHPSGRRYTLNTAVPPRPMPAWLLGAVAPKLSALPERRMPPVDRPSGEITFEGRRRMLGMVRLLEATPKGQRHRRLYWAARVAGAMAEAGLVDARVARDALIATADANGLAADEGEKLVLRTIADGMAKGGSL
jgi:hypothetical protein